MEGESKNINFIPCVKWIKRGVAIEHPAKVQLSIDELVKIIEDTKKKLSIADRQENETTSTTMEVGTSGTDEFHFDNYDADDGEETAQTLGIHALAELPTEAEDNFYESDDSEKEDDIIKPSDNLILVGHVDGDVSVLDVYVYNAEEESFYVHHDLLLPAFPLCLEWLDFDPTRSKGNYCAIGNMTPIIEVWDIDIINSIEPAFKLGKKAKKKGTPAVGHTDAVLALAWNKNFEHVIASGSVDHSILLWDIESQTPNTTIKAFNEKVQCLEWHRFEGQTLLAGACDNTTRVFDCKSPEAHQTWTLGGEAERLCWHPLEPFMFLVGTSVGGIECFDCRKGKLWTLEAHEKEVTGLSISSQCPGLMITASPDETVKTWDFQGENVPKLVNDREFKMGNIHCLDLCPDLPFVIAIGGDKKSNNFTVFDLQNIDPIRETFSSRELVQVQTQESSQSTQ